MRICIFGAGSVGGYLAAYLSRGGSEVSVVARGAHLAAIRADGLTVETPDESLTVRIAASDNPADLYDGGAITTFGSYKGYALSLLIEVLGGILSGGDTPIFPQYDGMNNGFAIAIEPDFFRSRPEFEAAIGYFFTSIKNGRPAQGSKGALIPGEPEMLQKSIRAKEGILIDDNTLAELEQTAQQFSVQLNLKPI